MASTSQLVPSGKRSCSPSARYTCSLKNLSEEDARSALQRERSLLYVAASRARDALVITTVGERSELLPEQG